jgi:hypothetical protein
MLYLKKKNNYENYKNDNFDDIFDIIFNNDNILKTKKNYKIKNHKKLINKIIDKLVYF